MQKPTLLCIDDEQSGLLLRRMMFEAEGYKVLTALSGKEGLEQLADSHVDAVILDYHMPTMDGAEVARAIRQRWPQLPIIMLSGFADRVPGDAVKLVNSFLTKGNSPEQLLNVIESTLAGCTSGRITILNVDDSEEHRYAVSRVLRKAGFGVLEARTGQEALQLASSRPSLIILDVNLPDMLGFDVCRRLKADPATRDIPVIHVSATYPAEAAATASIESGARRFIEHPQNLTEMVTLVQQELLKTRHSGAPGRNCA